MRRDEVLGALRRHRPELSSLGVSSLAVFGSVAREEAGPESDVDILVEFDRPVGLFEFVRLQQRLEALLRRRVDLVTPDALRARVRLAHKATANAEATVVFLPLCPPWLMAHRLACGAGASARLQPPLGQPGFGGGLCSARPAVDRVREVAPPVAGVGEVADVL